MSFNIYDLRIDRSRLLRVRDNYLDSIGYNPMKRHTYTYELISLVDILEDLELDIMDLERLDREGAFDDDYDEDEDI